MTNEERHADAENFFREVYSEFTPLHNLTDERQRQIVSSLRRNGLHAIGGSTCEQLRRMKTETRKGPVPHSAADELGIDAYDALARKILDKLK